MRRVLRQVMTGLVSISGACGGLAVRTTAAETSLLQPCAGAATQRHWSRAPERQHTRRTTVGYLCTAKCNLYVLHLILK